MSTELPFAADYDDTAEGWPEVLDVVDLNDPAGYLSEPTPETVVVVHFYPAPQGSKTKGRYGMWDDNAKVLKPWRAAVKTAAGIARGSADPIEGAVQLDVTFSLRRPKDHYGTGRNADLLKASAPLRPSTKSNLPGGHGDVDKLVRSVCDALTDAGVWADDCQVVELAARKVYVTEPGQMSGAIRPIHPDALTVPGCVARVRPL